MPADPEAGPSGPLLSVLVPVYNEQRTISELLRRVLAAPYDKEVIVVDDGSTDGTAAELAGWKSQGDLRLFHHAANRGKGAAIRTALKHARGRFTLVQDADLEYDPADYPALIEPLLAGEADVVYGSRYLRPGRRWRLLRMGVAVVNFGCRVILGARLTDMITCYKALPTSLLRAMELECERFEFCSEVTAKACRLRRRILEVPIQYHPRSYRDGKKIRCRDGLAMLWTLWKWRRWRAS